MQGNLGNFGVLCVKCLMNFGIFMPQKKIEGIYILGHKSAFSGQNSSHLFYQL